jgi:hypothetical protein
LNGTTGGAYEVLSAGTLIGQFFNDASGVRLRSGSTNLIFDTNNTERMRVDSGGTFYINTTNATLYNATSGYGVCYRVNASFDLLSTNDNCMIVNRTGTDGGSIEFRKSGTVVGGISVNGSSTAYNTSSDYRLKENIASVTGALNTVSALKPVDYTWKIDGTKSQGFIAHELQEVCPQAVTGEKDAVNNEGKPEYQSVDPSKIVALLAAAIQELNAKVDAQAIEIAALKGI